MVSELMRFKKERDEIDELFYEKEDFKLCIEKSKQFLNLIKKEGVVTMIFGLLIIILQDVILN